MSAIWMKQKLDSSKVLLVTWLQKEYPKRKEVCQRLWKVRLLESVGKELVLLQNLANSRSLVINKLTVPIFMN